MSTISISFDPSSLAKIGNLVKFELALQKQLYIAMGLATDALDTEIDSNMNAGFKNDTGDLYSTLQQITYGPYEAEIYTDSPYAFRREEGFSGMTDSLGRYYPDDPGIHYMADAVKYGELEVQIIFEDAVALALAEAAA